MILISVHGSAGLFSAIIGQIWFLGAAFHFSFFRHVQLTLVNIGLKFILLRFLG